MALVPGLDLRPDDPDPHALPANLRAEQALIGILLYDNEAMHALDGVLTGSAFFEPLHGRLFDSIGRAVRGGQLADPVVLGEQFRPDPAFRELGGVGYLADLAENAPPASNAREYAEAIADMHTRRELIRLSGEIAKMAKVSFSDDGGEAVNGRKIAESFQAHLTVLQINGTRDEFVPIGIAMGGALAASIDKTQPAGVTTGLAPLDLQLGPITAGDLILLAGRPGMGKSAISLAIATGVGAPDLADEMNGIDRGCVPRGVMIVGGEMSFGKAVGSGQVTRRHLADLGFHMFGRAFPTYKAIKNQEFGLDQYRMMEQAAARFATYPIVGLKRTGLRVSALGALARRQLAAWARAGVTPGLLIVDHVGLLRADGRFSGRYEEQTIIAIALKELADSLGLPILALVQLSRGPDQRDDKRPTQSDLRDSGAWEENADAIIFAYRESYYAAREQDIDPHKNSGIDHDDQEKRRKSKDIDLILGKLREGESGSTAKVWADLAHNAVRGREPDRDGLGAFV